MEDTLLAHWKRLIWKSAATPTLVYAGVRKIVTDFSFDIPAHLLLNPGIDYDILNYNPRAKHRQLERNYWDYEGVQAAVTKLKGRSDMPHSSVSIQLSAQKKDSRSQGYCMQNLVMVVTPQYSEVVVYYRSTELIQKFMADLIFFSRQLPPVFEELGIKPSWFRFRFANAYLSSEFIPMFIRIEDQACSFFRHMELHDERFFRSCSRSILTYSNQATTSSYGARIKMLRYWREHMGEDRLTPLTQYLTRRRKLLGER